MENRIRKVDVEKLNEEQIARVEKKISEEVSSIINRADSEINNLLNIYGMEAVLSIQFGLQGIKEKAKKIKAKKSPKTSK
jgi:uncharacterized hydantoinase/oxoprolinase family protein